MALPNLESIVHDVRNSQAWDFTTKNGLCTYSRAVVAALHAMDANFGYLRKVEAQNHCTLPDGRLVAVDVALYKPTGQVIDFIGSAGYGDPPPPNRVTWGPGPVDEYDAFDWYAPEPDGSGEPAVIPPVLPPTAEPPLPLDSPAVIRLLDLHLEVARQIGALNRQNAQLDQRVAIVEGRVNAIEATPVPVPAVVGPGRPSWWPF